VRTVKTDVSIIVLYSTGFSLLFQSVIFTKKSFRHKIPALKTIPRIMLLSLVLLCNTFTFLYAYQNTTFANAVLTHYIAPVLVVIMGWLILREQITKIDIIALCIATIGLWIMFGQNGFKYFSSQMTSELMGIIAGLGSGFFYALLIIMIRAFVKDYNPYVLVFFQNMFIVIYLLPFFKMISFKSLLLLCAMGLVHSTVAPYLYYYGLTGVPAHRAAVLGYLEPLGSILFGMIFFNELPAVSVYIGGALILLSGYLTIKKRSETDVSA